MLNFIFSRLSSLNILLLIFMWCIVTTSTAHAQYPKASGPQKSCPNQWIRIHGTNNDRDSELRSILTTTGLSNPLSEQGHGPKVLRNICKDAGYEICRGGVGWSGLYHNCGYKNSDGAVAVCCVDKWQLKSR